MELQHIIEFGGMEVRILGTSNFILNEGKNYLLLLLLLDLWL